MFSGGCEFISVYPLELWSAWEIPPLSLRLSFTSPPMPVFGERLSFLLSHPAWAGTKALLMPLWRHLIPPLQDHIYPFMRSNKGRIIAKPEHKQAVLSDENGWWSCISERKSWIVKRGGRAICVKSHDGAEPGTGRSELWKEIVELYPWKIRLVLNFVMEEPNRDERHWSYIYENIV
jgi:hypothetical protein